MKTTDKSLIDAHRKGDPDAFGEIVSRYGNSILGYLTKMTGNREQAEDLFQETFKRVHEKSHTLRGTEFRSWLYRIATNVALDGLRKRVRVESRERKLGFSDSDDDPIQVNIQDDSNNPSVQTIKTEIVEKVREAIKSLPDGQRVTLILAYYQQLSYREVALAMDCSVGTVKSQMYRALKTLAQKLPETEL